MRTTTNLAHLFALAALSLCAAAQNTWYVDVNAAPPGSGTLASPYASIQYAIDQPTTANLDMLLVAPGTYVEHVRIEDKWLTLRSSAGPESTIIQAQHAGNVVYLDNPSVVVEGFTITGHVPQGSAATAAVFVYTGTLRRCIVRDNVAGVFVDEQAVIVDSTIAGNHVGVNTNNFGCDVYITNSIVGGNTFDLSAAGAANVLATYSVGFESLNVEPGKLGPGTIVGDPRLWDVAADDFRLAPGSPCIDAGDPSSPLDPDGSRHDVGALPYDAGYAPAPSAYCTAKTNSLGCVPSIGASGSASASGSPFTITCSNELSHKLGLLFYGFAPKSTAYQGGYLCVQSPVHRTGLLDAGGTSGVDDCSGVYGYDFDALIQSGSDPALVAGAIVYAQFWSRDPAASFTTVRSDALRFGIAP